MNKELLSFNFCYSISTDALQDSTVVIGGCETHVTRKIDEQKRLLQDNDYSI